MSRDLRLRLLGRFELARDGVPIPLPRGSQRLLVLVALASGPVRRDTAAGRLWPEVPERRAHANLRAALARLRGRAPVLRANALEIALADRAHVDLDDGRAMARRLLDQHDSDVAAEAVPTLSLELLPGWYEDWILLEAENWRQQRLHALEAAAEALAADERWGDAIAAAEAAVSGDPLRESARAALIQVHLREGNQSEALREFERFRRLLHEELGLMPTPRLRTLMPGAGRGDVTDLARGRLVAMSVGGAQRAATHPLEAVTRGSRRRHGATEY